MKGSSLAIFLLLTISSCKSDLTPKEYQKELGRDEWTNSKDLDGYKFKVDYIPASWIAYLNTADKKSESEYKNELSKTDGFYYFRIQINTNGSRNLLKKDLQQESEYFDRLYYMSYLMKNDVFMKVGEDLYPCELYHYERAYDLSTKLSIMVGFKKPKDIKDGVTVVINPSILEIGKIKFKFNGSSIRNSPKLVLT